MKIARDNSGKSKDHLIVNRIRSCILTHSQLIERERIKKDTKIAFELAKADKKRKRNERNVATTTTN